GSDAGPPQVAVEIERSEIVGAVDVHRGGAVKSEYARWQVKETTRFRVKGPEEPLEIGEGAVTGIYEVNAAFLAGRSAGVRVDSAHRGFLAAAPKPDVGVPRGVNGVDDDRVIGNRRIGRRAERGPGGRRPGTQPCLDIEEGVAVAGGRIGRAGRAA